MHIYVAYSSCWTENKKPQMTAVTREPKVSTGHKVRTLFIKPVINAEKHSSANKSMGLSGAGNV